MSKRIYILLSLIIVLLLVITAILYSKNQSFESRINTLSKSIQHLKLSDSTSVKHEFYKAQFKEDYYIQQQNKDTTLILFVFGVVTVVLGYLSYNSFVHQVDVAVDKVKADYDDHLKKYEKQEHRLDGLMSDFTSREGFRNLEKSINSFDRKEYDWYIYYLFLSLNDFSDKYFIDSKKKSFETVCKLLIENANSDLLKALENLNGLNEIKNVNDETIQYCIKNIRRFGSVEIDEKAILLYSKLSRMK